MFPTQVNVINQLEQGECVLVTHGHYFEATWALASDWLLQFADDEGPLETPGEPTLQELVGMNLPLNQAGRYEDTLRGHSS